jgi:hypothetical protein
MQVALPQWLDVHVENDDMGTTSQGYPRRCLPGRSGPQDDYRWGGDSRNPTQEQPSTSGIMFEKVGSSLNGLLTRNLADSQ